jgi:hypothetical protein
MDDLPERLSALERTLEEFEAGAHPSWQTAEIFNALLTAAKNELPDDAVLDRLTAIRPAPATSSTDAGSMRVAVRQILRAMRWENY